ncbi:tetratricopeptide repeat protein 36 [Dendropsophus ebraccatus]|uniref:tetratricopeptide repeat protein 36 n=1 Tax=Dendropsophus ebraccatus TaxID=150705 RepID=UPI0038311785
MCTPNDSAVLYAIFNPSAPFGNVCEEKDNTTQDEPDLGALQDLNHAVELSKGMGIAGRQALVQRGLIFRLKGNDEAAREDFHKAAKLGSEFARQQLAQLNPYAALCNSMLKDMVKKLQAPDMQEY